MLQTTANKWGTMTSINEFTYATCKNMAKHCSKYYALKISIKEQNIIIEQVFKIWMFNNFGLAFKTYLTVLND